LVNQRVQVNDEAVHLTKAEFQLLATLARHAGELLTYRTLLSEALGPERANAIPLLKMTIAALRRKLEPDPLRPRHLLAEPGVGYRLDEEAMAPN
jgi:two-component system KDP operon response regulator KdpE